MYHVWTVFRDKGLAVDYYIINMETKAVQSVWRSLLEARAVCDKLNFRVHWDKKGGAHN